MENISKKSNAWIWWLLGLTVVGIAIYFIYKYTNLPNVVKGTLNGGTPVYNSAGSLMTDYGDTVNTDKPVMYGEKSNNVTRFQQAINDIIDKYKYNYTKLSIDGVYGAKTLAALQYISNNALNSGSTVNQVYNLPNIAAGSVGTGTYVNANTVPYGGQPVTYGPGLNPYGGRSFDNATSIDFSAYTN